MGRRTRKLLVLRAYPSTREYRSLVCTVSTNFTSASSHQSYYQSTHGYSVKHVNSVYSVNSYYCELCECGVKMASILKEHMEKVHSSHLMKPLMAAAGAVLAWKCKYP